MTILSILCVLTLSSTISTDAGKAIQTSWHLGPGVEGPDSVWGESFWTSDDVDYSAEGQLSLLAQSYNPYSWTKHRVDFHENIHSYVNILPADMNGDGYLDLVSLLYGVTGKVVIYEHTETGYVRHMIAEFWTYMSTVWPCDLDKDGDMDIVVAVDEGLFWLENDTGVFVRHAIDLSEKYLYGVPGDMDNDGDIDIVAHDPNFDVNHHGDVWLFTNDGSMTFSREKVFDATGREVWRINLGDLNGDGYLDIQTSGDPLRVLLNDRNGGFISRYVLNDTAIIEGSWLADFDADGDLDILGSHGGYALYSPKPLFWLENAGNGASFTYHWIGGGDGVYGDACMAIDVNMDGLTDALGTRHHAAWFEHLPDGSFLEHRLPGADLWSSHWIYGENPDGGPDVGDFDVDILVTDMDEFLLWENNIISLFKEGTLVSSILEVPKPREWTAFGWNDCEPEGCDNEYYVRSGEDPEGIKSSPWLGPLTQSGDSLKYYGVDNGSYFQYMVALKNLTAPNDISPSVHEVWVTFEEPDTCEPVEPWHVRSQGYWRRQCKNESHEEICACVDSIYALADLFDAFDCDSICALMNVSPPENDMCRKARRQFMALLLNVASGKLSICNCLEDGREVWTVIAEIDSLLSGDPDFHTCVYAKTLADDINSGTSIVPCNTVWIQAPSRALDTPAIWTVPALSAKSTVIEYELKTSGHVLLEIYDKAGRLVETLVDEVQQPGIRQVRWNRETNPSGVYFYRLKAGEFSDIKKVIVLR